MGNLRLMFSSNAMWAKSGYGVQGYSLLTRLAELPQFDGRQSIAQHAWYGLQGGIHHVDGFKIYPAGADSFGNDVIGAHTKNFGANVVVSLIDVWVLQEMGQRVAPALWLPWFPVDSDPIPDRVLAALETAHTPLSYSKWGHQMLNTAGIQNVYIPHGVESDTYRVIADIESVQKFKREMLNCAGHLTVMVCANKDYPDRKWLQGQIRAWAEFAQDKPDAKLYIHTDPTQVNNGINLVKLCQRIPLAPGKFVDVSDRVLFPTRYEYLNGFDAKLMALIYNAADVFMGNSMSEGFGIPLIEAQACGVPVITTDFASMSELVRWGFKVAPADLMWTQQDSWWAWPDKNGIVQALGSLYDKWQANGQQWPLEKRTAVSDSIHNEYGWDNIVAQYWAPLMATIEKAVQPTNAHIPAQSAERAPVASRMEGVGI